MTGYRASSAKEKACGVKSEDTRHQLPRGLPQWSHTGRAQSSTTSCDERCDMLSTRKLSRAPSAQGLLRAGHVGSLCVASTKTPDSRRKQVFNTNHVTCTNILGSASLSYHFWEWWEPSQNLSSQRTVQGPPFKLVRKESGLRSAV